MPAPDPYVLCEVFAAGGMAKVHFGQARQPDGSARLVAIKRVEYRPGDEELVRALHEEGELAQRLRHRHLSTAFDVVVRRDEAFLVMEYVHGATLGELCTAKGPLPVPVPVPVVATVLEDALRGLEYVHHATDPEGRSLGIVHRDVSPQNVLVGVDGVARLADFGIAKSALRATRTKTGDVKGKLAYLAPEQVHGRASPRSDLFALSVTAWEALVGRPLFADGGAGPGELLARILFAEVPAPSALGVDLDPRLEAILLRGLEREESARWETAGAMADAIAALGIGATREEVGRFVSAAAAPLLAERARRIAQLPTMSPQTRRRRMTIAAVAAAALATTAVALGVARHPAPTLAAEPTVNAETSGSTTTDASSVAPSTEAPAPSAPPAAAAAATVADRSERRPPAAVKRRAPAPAAHREGCQPPYTVDAQSRKIFKPQCF